MSVYNECKKREFCAEAIYRRGIPSAGIPIWQLRHLEGCRFADIKKEKCILYKKELSPQKREYEGRDSCYTALTKTWENLINITGGNKNG